MSKDNVAFRSSVNGYNKKDVYKYLESLNREIISRDEEAKNRIAVLTADNISLTENNLKNEEKIHDLLAQLETSDSERKNILSKHQDELEEYSQRISILSAQTEEKDLIIKDLSDNLTESNNDILSLKDQITQKDILISELDSAAVKISIELDKLTEQYNALLSNYDQIAHSIKQMDEIKRKADAYDKISERIRSSTNHMTQDPQAYTQKQISTDNVYDTTPTTQELLDYIKDAQARFNTAIEHAQNETNALKIQIEKAINASKQKIINDKPNI